MYLYYKSRVADNHAEHQIALSRQVSNDDDMIDVLGVEVRFCYVE